MRRLVHAVSLLGSAVGTAAVVIGLVASPTAAAQQSLSFYVGGFTPRDESGRVADDVLLNNLDFLAFNIKDFNMPAVGAEYLVGLGDTFEAGLGAGFQGRSVPSVYLDFVNANGTEIEQDLELRMVPVTATFRFLPLGHRSAVVPYFGGGVAIVRWRYTESGQFLANDNTIFRDDFAGAGTATGPVILGGLRFPAGKWNLGFELRYQNAKGDLPSTEGFSGSKIDLGGFNYSFTAAIKF